MRTINGCATVLALLLLVMLLGACSEEGTSFASSDCCATTLPTGEVSETSLYNLESSWRDQDGRERKLSELRGDVRLVAMIFTRCAYSCPLLLSDLKALEARLDPGAPVGFVLASFDTERDVPGTLAAYARKNRLSSEKWTLLHGSRNTVRELAAALGVKYRKIRDGGFSHSNQITLLDAGGEIVHQHAGLGADLEPALQAIRKQLSTGQ